MKNTKITSIMLILVFISITGIKINAQGNKENQFHSKMDKMHEMLKLSDDQISNIEDLQIANMKEMLQFKNKLNELIAKEQSLASAEKTDMKAINTNIDEITSHKNKMMKQQAKHHQAVRELFTEDQRVKFDSFKHDRSFKHCDMNHKGYHSKKHKFRKFDDN